MQHKIINREKVIIEGGFYEAFHSLPSKCLKDARIEICNLCYWSVATFKSKQKGKHPFRAWEVQKIEEFFRIRNINAWTGENLN